ncbi:hypothetical protein LguiA_016531 [Lonicera macranthoides]
MVFRAILTITPQKISTNAFHSIHYSFRRVDNNNRKHRQTLQDMLYQNNFSPMRKKFRFPTS